MLHVFHSFFKLFPQLVHVGRSLNSCMFVYLLYVNLQLCHTHTHFSLNNLLVCIYTDEHDDGRTDAWHAEPRDDASPAAAGWYDDAAAGLHDAERVRSPATSTATTTFKSGYSK